MKKLASILAGLCLVLTAQAQDSPTDIASPDILTQPKFILKTNLTSYAFTAINLNFEAKTSPVTSVGLLGAYMLPRTYDLSALVTDSEGDTFDYDGEIEPSGVFITPYFRYYPSGSMTGFYAETFARYYNMEFGVPYNFMANNGKTYANDLEGTANGFGGGVCLGGQFKLGSKLYLDIYGGAGVASGSVHLETNDPNLTPEDFAEIKKALDENKTATADIFILGNTLSKATADSDLTSAWADIESELFPLFRFGICIGIGI